MDHFAHRALANLDRSFSTDQVLEHFAAAHRESQGSTDFIVAFGDGRLARVSSEGTTWTSDAWIGNVSAFREYQARYAAAMKEHDDVPRDLRPFISMDVALRGLIDDQTHEDVGDFIAGVVLHDGAFEYQSYSESAAERERVFHHATGRWEPDEPEGPSTGGYFIAAGPVTRVADPLGPRGLALHFGRANFGWLYLPDGGFPRPLQLPGDADAFAEAVRDRGFLVDPLARPM